ncbi:ras-related protein Rap-2a-like [Sinocyclocheilus rhinocerous]|uniref:ras-related protein Rap-2a-like n=1 Tax=Sinocyclocheilus rhinocerous TaxID=307959 RepID=UPI0007BA4D29|nr:PREDICTED: ras-related protein Rap-2a-like [Sinocyclocheilus rhinocerous]
MVYFFQAVPHALLAKRVALEQTAAAGCLFNRGPPGQPTTADGHSITPYTVPMMLGAPAVPAVSPYVAAATANASQIILNLVNQQSFQDIKPMRDQIIRVKRYEKVPVILVGNKVDLESEREVSVREGQALAEEWGCPFIETSAKSKTMVDELFAEIVRQMDFAAQPDKDDPCCSSCNIQ